MCIIVTSKKLVRTIQALSGACLEAEQCIYRLREENSRLRKRIEELEDSLTACDTMLNDALDESHRLDAEVEGLRAIIDACKNPLEGDGP